VTTDHENRASLDINRMLYRYTRPFYRSDPEDALHYLFFICMGKGDQALCRTYVQEVVLDTRQFSALLAEARVERREPGFIYRHARLICGPHSDVSEFVDKLVSKLAKTCVEERRLEDAVHLFNLAGRYNEVVELIVRKLGESVTRPSAQIKEEAQRVLSFYSRQPVIFSHLKKDLMETCKTLVTLVDFFSFAQAGQVDQAIQAIESTGLLPIGDRYNNTQLVSGFDSLDHAIKKNFPQIITTTMDLLYALSLKYQNASFADPGRQKVCSSLCMFLLLVFWLIILFLSHTETGHDQETGNRHGEVCWRDQEF